MKTKRVPDLVDWRYDIIKEETQAGPLAVLWRPLNKQAGYHITNIYLTLLQKVFCRERAGEGAVPEPLWLTCYQP